MRIDQVLHWLCLRKSRSLASRACQQGLILLNGSTVRPAHSVRVGDHITLLNARGEAQRELRLRDVPHAQVSRKEAAAFYDVLPPASRGESPPDGGGHG